MPIRIYGEDARKIISTREFHAYNMAEKYIELSARTGMEFDAVIQLLQHLPLFLNEDNHKYQRRALAGIYASSRVQQQKNVDETLIKINQAIQLCEGDLDVLSEISYPIWGAVTSGLSNHFSLDAQLISELPELFFPNLSLRRRKDLNDRLQKELNKIADKELEYFLQTIAVLTLGVRPLVHSLTLSIHKIAKQNSQKCLSSIEYPKTYADSSLRFIDRIASQDIDVNGIIRSCGEHFRCISFDEAYAEKDNAKYIFGAGGHVCLGRPISDYIWQGIIEVLQSSKKIISPGALEITEREPFLIAEACSINLRSNDDRP